MARRTAPLLVLLAGLLPACTSCNPTPDPPKPPRENQPNVKWCPGAPGCMAEGEGQILAGAARRSILPRAWEMPNPNYLKSTNCDPIMLARFGVDRCGELPDERPRNCGTDGICPGDPGYPGPDTDGTEGDAARKQDWFYDCGGDRICPPPQAGDVVNASNTPEPSNLRSNGIDDDGDGAIDDGEYPGPDMGEGDNLFMGAWIAGFGTNRPAMGALDDVDVRCFALRTQETTTVHCVVDAVGFFYDEVVRARAELATRHPEADVDYLSMSSTHTHEAVDTMGQWGRAEPIPITPGRLEGHNAFIVSQMVDAAAEAVAQLQPARLVLTETHTGADNYLRDSRDPQVMDDTMTLVEARGASSGQTIFTVIHWGNHPEVLSDENNLMSSDYCAYTRTRIEQGFQDMGLAGRGGLAIYVQGTVGGLMTPLGVTVTGRDGTVHPPNPARVARVVAYGENLAVKALQALADESNHTTVETAAIKVKAQQFYIPIQNRAFIFAFAAGLFDRGAYEAATGLEIDTTTTSLLDVEGSARTEVFTLDIGPWSIVSVPGEVFPEVADEGYDGEMALGRPFNNENLCPPSSECDALPNCPAAKPEGGWQNCDCETCRLCKPHPVADAPRGVSLKTKMPGRFKTVFGLGNDELGYMVPPYDWHVSEVGPFFCEMTDHYEETNSTGEPAVPATMTALQYLWDFAL